MIIAHNGTCTNYCDLPTDMRIARETGYDGIEIIGSKLYKYLDAGNTAQSLLPYLEGISPVALGYVQDIERQRPKDVEALLQECDKMCALAQSLGCPMVQLLTGPIGPGIGEGVPQAYREIVGMEWPKLRDLTAGNVKQLSQIGRQYEVSFYLEALSWAPIHTLQQARELIDSAQCDNIGLLIDFWHCYTSGSKPEELAALDAKMIGGVHYCDSVSGDGSSHSDRNVQTGDGIIPLKDWLDAVISTGFDGWISCELFSLEAWDQDPWQTAKLLRDQLAQLLV